jgi:ppGpp synthetase/RelA/SpoT-type nucleotidyltranferase
LANASAVDDDHAWLSAAIPLHERLSAAVASLIENILRKNEIEYLNITARTKDIEGALEKIRRKEYANPQEQLTDLSGMRVVTYLEEQATQIAGVVKELFQVDEANSHDRSADLGEDKMGYRSTHFVCTLGKERGALPEYEGIGNLKFEIQVRTVLQHAWAELAHDRSFKFGVALPAKIQRKLNLYSGMLEIVDGAFDEIAREIDQYKLSLERKTVEQISATDINSISVAKFISEVGAQLNAHFEDNTDETVLGELKQYGVNTIGDLESLMTNEFKTVYSNFSMSRTSTGLLRHLMMYSDLDKYFGSGRHFDSMSPYTIRFLETKYRNDEVRQWLKRLKIGLDIPKPKTPPPKAKKSGSPTP